MADDDFELWIGRSTSDRSLSRELLVARQRAGRQVRCSVKGGRFTGERIGRGSAIARLLSSTDRYAGSRARRVVVKARIVRLGRKGTGAAAAHLRYLQRDGTTREGERGMLYGPDRDEVDGKAFLERAEGDRHQFRFIVAPEDGAEYDDLKPLVRRLMSQVEQDLDTKLDWVAVDHFNTGHPHSHIMLRGVDDRRKNLIIAREYMSHGLRERAAGIVNLDLGPRTDREIMRSRLKEVEQERLTGIDRRLLASADERGLVRPTHGDGVEQSLRAGRLQKLARLGLADEVVKGQWRLHDDIEPVLRRMGERGDIIRTMQREMTARVPERSPADFAIYDPAEGKARPVIGRLVSRGLSDEHADRHYVIVDGIDGRSHYVDIGGHGEELTQDSIIRVTPRMVAVRQVDRTIAEVAEAHGGRYSVTRHLIHDPTAAVSFAEAHVRRLEAIRRRTGAVARESDDSWIIAPDHLERVMDYERALAERDPVSIETLSSRPLDRLPGHDGLTWLDQELVSREPSKLERGFGAEARKALEAREQWLVRQGLAERKGDHTLYAGDLEEQLHRRDLQRAAGPLARELGLPFRETRPGDPVDGNYRGAVQVGDAKYALIEKSLEFTLVPWRPVLERALGRQVSGIMRESGISWTIGRDRGIDISM